jgi:putative SOS response-associated peptidase YedK
MPDADYNIAPTTQQPIVRESRDSKDREIVLARWGLIPFFTKTLDEVKGLSTINPALRPSQPLGRGESHSVNGGALYQHRRFTNGRSMGRTQNSPMYSSFPREARLRLPDYGTPGKTQAAIGCSHSPSLPLRLTS